MTDPTTPNTTEPEWQNHSERLKLDYSAVDRRFDSEHRGHDWCIRAKALDYALVYHRDITKPDFWDKTEKAPPCSPEELVATAREFLPFLSERGQ
jgi:hypothetical protein